MRDRENPFRYETDYGYGHREWVEAIDSKDRVAAVARFSREQCVAALEVPGLQKRVAQALRGRLRRLETAP
ncbi:MAG: hypothetical protein AB1578_20045 [Thermodesulfobacteriota bacterium]